MKYMKITVTKEIANGGINYIYPDGYDKFKINVTGYEHNADKTKERETELMLGVASDDFSENADMVALDKAAYDAGLIAITP